MRAEGRIVWPPQRDWQVVDEQRHDDRGQVQAGLAAHDDVDGFGAGLGPATGRGHGQGVDAGLQTGRTFGVHGGRESANATRAGWRHPGSCRALLR